MKIKDESYYQFSNHDTSFKMSKEIEWIESWWWNQIQFPIFISKSDGLTM